MFPEAIFGFVHLYGLMIGLGLIVAFFVLYFYAKKQNVEQQFLDFLFNNGIFSILIGFLTAMLFQATYNFIQDPQAGFHFGSGMTFIGGLIGGVCCFMIVYAIFLKKYNTKLLDVISIFPCCITIAHAFGRIGCFFAGCCYGKETNSFWGVKFPNLPNPVYPTQLFEAAFLFFLFALFSYLLLRKHFRYNMSLYLIFYGVFRFFIEFLRGDDRGQFIIGISPSQFWSIIMVIVGIGSYFILRNLYERKNKKTT